MRQESSKRKAKSSVGGAAATSGIDFQSRVAAWLAVHILAEKGASPLWDLAAGTTLEFIRCETEQPVDDILVGTSSEGAIFIQAKRTLDLSSKPKSALPSTFDQFVRQFIDCKKATGAKPWEHPLDPQRDRLVLATSPENFQSIRVHLRKVLNGIRGLVAGQSVDEAAKNEKERQALGVAIEHCRHTWRDVLNSDPSDDDIRQVLSLIYVESVDVEDGRVEEREAKNLLRKVVLRNENQADTAWATLITFCMGLAKERSEADRPRLRQALLKGGVGLVDSNSVTREITPTVKLPATPEPTPGEIQSITTRLKSPYYSTRKEAYWDIDKIIERGLPLDDAWKPILLSRVANEPEPVTNEPITDEEQGMALNRLLRGNAWDTSEVVLATWCDPQKPYGQNLRNNLIHFFADPDNRQGRDRLLKCLQEEKAPPTRLYDMLRAIEQRLNNGPDLQDEEKGIVLSMAKMYINNEDSEVGGTAGRIIKRIG